MSSAVRFAAMMPASLAVCRGSPFLTARVRIARTAAALIRTSPVAMASRTVSGLAPTSTILTRPRASTWESWTRAGRRSRPLIGILAREKERQAFERHREIDVLQFDARRHLEGPRGKIENRPHACLHRRVDDALSRVGRHGDDRGIDAVAVDGLA